MDQHISPIDYEFAGFRLDTNLQVLLPPSGPPIQLTSKVFQTLLYLVEHAGEVADKRSLMQAVWPNVIVEENNLNQCIGTIRKVFRESAPDRRFVLTIPGRGFKFVVATTVIRQGVEPVATTEMRGLAAQDRPLADALRPHRPGRGRIVAALIGVTSVSILAATVAWIFNGTNAPVTRPSEYEQLTDVAEAASAPALSPDGRILAYVLGGDQFLGAGQIYVKLLPAGKPVQLTHVSGSIYSPAFSFDGNRIAFTHATDGAAPIDWETLTVPVLGGTPTLLLPNSSGLSWIAPATLMYSEIKSGIHMGIVTSTESRSEHRDIYIPAHERGMAHFSFVSPDNKSVLVVEMNPSGDFERCRLVPFDGTSSGEPVGPMGTCLSAAWSPDSKWMYFAVSSGRYSHLWRQRFPNGDAQQITFGPTKETAVVAAPDGRSLLTSLGTEQSAIWIHDTAGERRLTSGTSAWHPWLSKDGQRLYFLRRQSTAGYRTDLMRADLAMNDEQVLFPGLDVQTYDISADEQEVLFTSGGSEPRVLIAPIDRHAPPRVIAQRADQAVFAGARDILYRQIGTDKNYVYRMDYDGGHNTRVIPNSVWDILSVSPNGRLVIVGAEVEGHPATGMFRTQDATLVWQHPGYWPARWSPDGKFFYQQMGWDDATARTVAKPAIDGGIPADASTLTGDTTEIPRGLDTLFPTADPATYLFVNSEERKNIFRIPLH